MNNKINKWIFFSLILIIIFFMSGSVSLSGSSEGKVYIIPIVGEIDPGMAAYLKRAFRDIPDTKGTTVIIKIDTFGGRIDSTFEIINTILDVVNAETIAYVEKEALSAGSLIALSCNKLVMENNTTIGDCAPISYSTTEGAKALGEKVQSPLRAKFRTLAKRNGYPEALAESMVTAEMEIYEVKIDGKIQYMDLKDFDNLTKKEKARVQSKKVIVAKGELLTMDDTEALNLGFSKMSVRNIDEMLKAMDIANRELVTIEESWSESFVGFINGIAGILMMIGLAALYTEIKSPGFGVPGIIGITCLALVFLNQYFVGLADYTELLLIVTGILLLGFELFVTPGFGVAGFSGLICISIGMILGFQDFVIPDPSFPWEKELLINNSIQVFGAALAAFVLSLLVIRFILPKISLVIEGPYLDTTLEKAHADSSETGFVTIGDSGTAMTFLRPSGKMKIKTEIIDVIAEGEFIEKGTSIKVIEINGNRIIVAKSE